MTVRLSANLWCDGDGCTDAYRSAAVSPFGTAAEVRADAAGWGWTTKGRKDFCPEHSPERTDDGH